MNEKDIAEQAYKNGYNQAIKDFSERLKDKYLPIVSSYFSEDDPNQFELNDELCDLTESIQEEMTGQISNEDLT